VLTTPDKIRELQRKLYLKAKQETSFRFYLLYDKVYRMDILRHAYHLVKANKGAAGVDGVTFEAVEEKEGGEERYLEEIAQELREKRYKPMPIRRVKIPKPGGGERPLGIPTIKDRVVQMAVKIVIEPIFEADFQENSYGYRPKRDAHQALEDVAQNLLKGRTQVIDADLTKYFDTIPHDHLMNLVARRIVDKHILRLIKLWLKAPVVEEDGKGKKRITPNDKGTPQGGVLSPLLANIYLNVLDTIWKLKRVEERFEARLIRYADDLVVLCRKDAGRIMRGVEHHLETLGLTLNRDKTHIVEAAEEGFTFLGFTFQMKQNPKTGKWYPLTVPSKQAMARIREGIKGLTGSRMHALGTPEVIRRVNRVLQGWVNYFHYGNCVTALKQLRSHVEQRVRIYLRRRHRLPGQGFKRFPTRMFYAQLGLFKIPTSAPWKHPAKATGRR